jgi:hypothetical protein
MNSQKAHFLTPTEVLEIARNRTPKERFLLLMRLIKMQRMIAQHRPKKS